MNASDTPNIQHERRGQGLAPGDRREDARRFEQQCEHCQPPGSTHLLAARCLQIIGPLSFGAPLALPAAIAAALTRRLAWRIVAVLRRKFMLTASLIDPGSAANGAPLPTRAGRIQRTFSAAAPEYAQHQARLAF